MRRSMLRLLVVLVAALVLLTGESADADVSCGPVKVLSACGPGCPPVWGGLVVAIRFCCDSDEISRFCWPVFYAECGNDCWRW